MDFYRPLWTREIYNTGSGGVLVMTIMKNSGMIFITGGARSGKSFFAEKLAFKAGADRVYLATMQALDEEMKERIARHRAVRKEKKWRTVEEPLDLLNVLKRENKKKRVILIDCLTLWITNMMLKAYSEKEILSAAEALAGFAGRAEAQVIVVSNEVGMGIVPDNVLGRNFRDTQGRVNQIFAAQAKKVYFMVAGLPLKVKK